jgi:hypothetical protein
LNYRFPSPTKEPLETRWNESEQCFEVDFDRHYEESKRRWMAQQDKARAAAYVQMVFGSGLR